MVFNMLDPFDFEDFSLTPHVKGIESLFTLSTRYTVVGVGGLLVIPFPLAYLKLLSF